MNRIIKTTLALAILALGFSCSTGPGEGIKTVIKGHFPDFSGYKVSLSEIDINQVIPVDTVRISDNGSFRFSFKRPGPGFYLVKIDNRNFITLVLDREEKIELTAEGKEIKKNYRVSGSEDSELYRQFEVFLETNRSKVDSLRKIFSVSQKSASFQTLSMQLDSEYDEIYQQQRQYVLNFLKNHCESLASLLVINRRFGERQVISPEEDASYYLAIDSCLSEKYPGNKHLLEHQKRVETISNRLKIKELAEKKLAIGNKAPDVSLLDLQGRERSLYSLSGRPVILYFWASWDKNCQDNNVRLKNQLEKMGAGKPTVFAVGLESYQEMWENAIRRDGIGSWVHVTDFLNVHSSVKTLYNLPEELPYFYLLDRELTILFKGQDLDALIDNMNKLAR